MFAKHSFVCVGIYRRVCEEEGEVWSGGVSRKKKSASKQQSSSVAKRWWISPVAGKWFEEIARFSATIEWSCKRPYSPARFLIHPPATPNIGNSNKWCPLWTFGLTRNDTTTTNLNQFFFFRSFRFFRSISFDWLLCYCFENDNFIWINWSNRNQIDRIKFWCRRFDDAWELLSWPEFRKSFSLPFESGRNLKGPNSVNRLRSPRNDEFLMSKVEFSP